MAKADQTELQALFEMKTNKVDTEQVMNSQIVLSRQMKHLAVLFIESVKVQLAGALESQLNKNSKRQFILQQANALAKWVLQFDPAMQNSALGLGTDILAHDENDALETFTH